LVIRKAFNFSDSLPTGFSTCIHPSKGFGLAHDDAAPYILAYPDVFACQIRVEIALPWGGQENRYTYRLDYKSDASNLEVEEELRELVIRFLAAADLNRKDIVW